MKFLRSIQLNFPDMGVNVVDLRIDFDVEKTVSGIPNAATIKVYNLSRATRTRLKEEGGKVELLAGYRSGDGELGLAFAGTISDVVHEYTGDDVVTTLECGDGDKSQVTGFISKTYPRGASIESIVWDIQELGMPDVSLGDTIGLATLPALQRALSFQTTPRRALDELGRTYGFYWSIQNGALEVVKKDRFIPSVTDLTPETGLIDTPAISDKGITARALLDTAIRPNRVVRLDSDKLRDEGASGEYRVSSVRYTGSNYSGDNTVELEGERIHGDTVVDV